MHGQKIRLWLSGVSLLIIVVGLLYWRHNQIQKKVQFYVSELDHMYLKNRDEAQSALLRIGRPAIPPLIRSLKHERPRTRILAAKLLGELKATSAIPGLIPMLRDKYVEARWNAVESLGKIGHPSAIDSLVSVADDPSIKKEIVEALKKIDPRLAALSLKRMLKVKKDEQSLIQGLWILGQVSQLEEKEFLRGYLEDTNFQVQKQATYVLAEVGDTLAVSNLDAYLRNTDVLVRYQSFLYRSPYTDSADIPLLLTLLKDDYLRFEVMRILYNYVDLSMADSLVMYLNDPKPETRLLITKSLTKISGKNFGFNQAQWKSYFKK